MNCWIFKITKPNVVTALKNSVMIITKIIFLKIKVR